MYKMGKRALLSFIYGSDFERELGQGCISFEREQMEKNGAWRLWARLLALALVLVNSGMSLIAIPAFAMLILLTNWIVITTTLTVFLLILWASDPHISQKKGKLAVLHLLYSVSLVLSQCFLIYWVFIHPFSEQKDPFIQMHAILVHINPLISLAIVHWTTDIYLIESHWVSMVPIHCAYDVINFVVVRALGKPLYWFIDWTSFHSVVYCGLIILYQCLGWILTAHLLPK